MAVMTPARPAPKKKHTLAKKVVAGSAAIAALTGLSPDAASASVASNWSWELGYGAGVDQITPAPGAPTCPNLSSGWQVYNTPAYSDEHIRVNVCYAAWSGSLHIDAVYIAQLQHGAADIWNPPSTPICNKKAQAYNFAQFMVHANNGNDGSSDVQNVVPTCFMNRDGLKWAIKAMYPGDVGGNHATVWVHFDRWRSTCMGDPNCDAEYIINPGGEWHSYNVSLK